MASKWHETPYDQLTYRIIGCAMASHRKLGPGHREVVYRRDLEAHLTEAGLPFESQKAFPVYDTAQSNAVIGYYIPDLIVNDTVVVEIKALAGLDNTHIAQVIGYLLTAGCPLGLLVNFGARSLQFRRILPPKHITHHVNRQWLFAPDSVKRE